MLNIQKLSQELTALYGVQMTGVTQRKPDGLYVEFRPVELPSTTGFTVGILIGWRVIEVKFSPATFARPILMEMSKAEKDKRGLFCTFVQAAINSGAKVEFKVNDESVDIFDIDRWPSDWRSIFFNFSIGPIQIDISNSSTIETIVLSWSSKMLGSVLALMPLEASEIAGIGEAEGSAYDTLNTKYERSSLNRQACIEFHGTTCKVCGFDFKKFYGHLGDGYIEVHHIEPLANIGNEKIWNPVTDLVPLCSNCHSMVHRRRPIPYSVDELRNLIDEAKSQA